MSHEFIFYKAGTKQYDVTQLLSEEDEQRACEMLLEKAKSDGMLEWVGLPRKIGFNIKNNKKYVRFGLMANPFHTQQKKDSMI